MKSIIVGTAITGLSIVSLAVGLPFIAKGFQQFGVCFPYVIKY